VLYPTHRLPTHFSLAPVPLRATLKKAGGETFSVLSQVVLASSNDGGSGSRSDNGTAVVMTQMVTTAIGMAAAITTTAVTAIGAVAGVAVAAT